MYERKVRNLFLWFKKSLKKMKIAYQPNFKYKISSKITSLNVITSKKHQLLF